MFQEEKRPMTVLVVQKNVIESYKPIVKSLRDEKLCLHFVEFLMLTAYPVGYLFVFRNT